MSAYVYPIALAIISVVVAVLERLFPWRPEQRALRAGLWPDFLHLVFNGHFLGLILFGVATHHVLPHVDGWLAGVGLYDVVYRDAAASWPLWLQIVVVMVVIDFVQWCVHNLLHRVPLFWQFHKSHHSIVDGEMDWIVSFRFQWSEVVVYRTVQYVPLAFFGFAPEAVMTHAIFGTLIGHLNHANLNWSWGPLRYVFNSPAMHIWHHDYDADGKSTVNFGIIFSTWDWLFGTAKMPGQPPERLGFDGVESYPKGFFGQMAWPLPAVLRSDTTGKRAASAFGVVVIAAGYWLSLPPSPSSPAAQLEVGASSQPARALSLASPDEANEALARFGEEAREAGYARPEFMVSVAELEAALGSPRLVLLDVRAQGRFAEGHLPSARPVARADYSVSEPIPGLSRSRAELEELLRANGVARDSVVVLYGDGGPEPYRLWWTLREIGAFDTRVLDGGLQAWKAAELPAPRGEAESVARGDVVLSGSAERPPLLWQDLQDVLANPDAHLVDTRSEVEFLGSDKHGDASRAGRVPGAEHLEWSRVLRDRDGGDPRLLSPIGLKRLFDRAGLESGHPVVSYCQSGTRSSAVHFALLQAGFAEDDVVNYDGSFAEYSRLDVPVEVGAPTDDDAGELHACTSDFCPLCYGEEC